MSFFEGFFKRYTDSHDKLKEHNVSFSEDDKSRILEHYFKLYYTEKLNTKPKLKRKITKINAAQNVGKISMNVNPK